MDISKYNEVSTRDILGVVRSNGRVRKPGKPKKVKTRDEFHEAFGQNPQTEASVRKILRQHGDDLYDYFAM